MYESESSSRRTWSGYKYNTFVCYWYLCMISIYIHYWLTLFLFNTSKSESTHPLHLVSNHRSANNAIIPSQKMDDVTCQLRILSSRFKFHLHPCRYLHTHTIYNESYSKRQERRGRNTFLDDTEYWYPRACARCRSSRGRGRGRGRGCTLHEDIAAQRCNKDESDKPSSLSRPLIHSTEYLLPLHQLRRILHILSP